MKTTRCIAMTDASTPATILDPTALPWAPHMTTLCESDDSRVAAWTAADVRWIALARRGRRAGVDALGDIAVFVHEWSVLQKMMKQELELAQHIVGNLLYRRRTRDRIVTAVATCARACHAQPVHRGTFDGVLANLMVTRHSHICLG